MTVPPHDPENIGKPNTGHKLVRIGGPLAPAGTIAVMFAGAAVNAILGDGAFTTDRFKVAIGVLSLAGQLLIWAGMHQVRRARAWHSGVTEYLWFGAIFTTFPLCAFLPYPALLVPWVAPVVATLAKRRTHTSSMPTKGGTT